MEAPLFSRNAFLSVTVLLILCMPIHVCSEEYKSRKHYDKGSMLKRYEVWLQRYSYTHKNRDEWNQRFGIYQSNVQFIDYINSQNLSFTLVDNRFADMTNKEFKSIYLGYRKTSALSNGDNFTYDKYGAVPTSVDWRNKGAVTPIKDQGQCDNVGLLDKFYRELSSSVFYKELDTPKPQEWKCLLEMEFTPPRGLKSHSSRKSTSNLLEKHLEWPF